MTYFDCEYARPRVCQIMSMVDREHGILWVCQTVRRLWVCQTESMVYLEYARQRVWHGIFWVCQTVRRFEYARLYADCKYARPRVWQILSMAGAQAPFTPSARACLRLTVFQHCSMREWKDRWSMHSVYRAVNLRNIISLSYPNKLNVMFWPKYHFHIFIHKQISSHLSLTTFNASWAQCCYIKIHILTLCHPNRGQSQSALQESNSKII